MLARDKLKYFSILKRQYPHANEASVRLFEDGNDHYVFVVDKTHAFRFPRTENSGKNDTSINAFSQMFAPHSPVPIQKMTGHVDSITGQQYQTYEFLPGRMFTEDFAKTLSEEECIGVAKDLGIFLKKLHTFPIQEAEIMRIEALVSPQNYANYFRDIIQVDREAVGSLLTDREWEWIERQTKDFVDLSYAHPYSFTVTHSDMQADHMLLEEKTHKLCGIIDFSLRIADPANDFKLLHPYGEVFLKTVYENYLPVDEFFDKRRAFYSGDFYLAMLYKSVVDKREDKVKLFLTKLREYISKHA